MQEFRDKNTAQKIVSKIQNISQEIDSIQLMHVCGTHEDTISKYGLRSLLPDNIEIISGPGCPVCVTTPKEIDEALYLAQTEDCILTTFGDMLRVPGTHKSLREIRATNSGDVQIVYSPSDAVKLARDYPKKEVVHLGIGFETTAPSTALELKDAPNNFSVLSCHRLIPPAMEFLLSTGESADIDGFIDPGHVSAIIGCTPYRPISKKYGIPQVVAGFEPLDVLMSVFLLLEMIKKDEKKVKNEYNRVVKEKGNERAIEVLDKVFKEVDVAWRGFPEIPNSGLIPKKEFEQHDARKKFDVEIEESSEPAGCRCGEVLKGLIYPQECELFGKQCTPQEPIGPCMVSNEGACAIAYKYGDDL